MHGRTVLVIDDNAAIRTALEVLLSMEGAVVESADSPAAGLARVAAGDVDLVIQDMNFRREATSGQEGIDLFRALRRADPDLPVVLLTAWTSLETAVELVKAGAADYLAKPWDNTRLVTTVRNLLQLRTALVDAVQQRQRTAQKRAALATRFDLRGIVYESEAMQRVVSLAVQVAASDVPVLITGPNGAGKEKIAEIVHANSRRRQKPLVRVNSGAIPENLIESELFGAEPGAYTGSTRLRIGRFEAANGGTIFLDEIGNLSAAGQMKLLRVLQSGEFERLGSSETRRVDVRVICATNADLRRLMARGAFRQDLYFRLNVVEIAVPPLGERREDVIPLAEAFLASPKRLSDDARAALLAHDWPGNVRELQNRVQRAMALGAETVTAADLGFNAARDFVAAEVPMERTEIEMALLNAGGSVKRAAEALGVSRQALYRRMEKLGIVLERRPR